MYIYLNFDPNSFRNLSGTAAGIKPMSSEFSCRVSEIIIDVRIACAAQTETRKSGFPSVAPISDADF